MLAAGAIPLLRPAEGRAALARPNTDATFVFTNDVHACHMSNGVNPNCLRDGKTDENLRRHIAALNRVSEHDWPSQINDLATGLESAGRRIVQPLGLVVGGDMTDDGGGQIAIPSEGSQLLQFAHRYQEGAGPHRVHFPVYVGLGNHDLDQDGPPQHVDWYRREMRDYVEINHRPSVFFKPPVPATNYDSLSDSYSWDWGGLHLVQMHRFAGDIAKGAVSGLGWLSQDLKTYASDGRPVLLFQHYGWDPFSIERWDPVVHGFNDTGMGAPHWWSDADRQALVSTIAGYNVIGIFHGHEHQSAMIYKRGGLDLFKPKAAFLGGFAIVRITDDFMDVVLAEAKGTDGELTFTNAFSKKIPAGTP